MADVVVAFPVLSDMVYHQFLLSLMGFAGSAVSFYFIRTVEDGEWREAGMNFTRALALFGGLELAELTGGLWFLSILMILTEIALITYIVYGIIHLRLLIEDRI